jgi:hypothetical protein
MTKLAKEILTKFDEYRFYLGENMNIDGMVVLQYYREDGSTPVFIYFKDGLKEEKYVSLENEVFFEDLLFLFIVNKNQSIFNEKQHD